MSEEIKKTKTIEDRVRDLMVKFKIEESNDEFLRSVMELVERGSNPKNFCPKCDYRLTFNAIALELHCVNCGYAEGISSVKSSDMQPQKITSGTSALPSGVEKLIEKSGPISKKGKSAADQINALRNKSEGTGGNEMDEGVIKSHDPKIKSVKWC